MPNAVVVVIVEDDESVRQSLPDYFAAIGRGAYQ